MLKIEESMDNSKLILAIGMIKGVGPSKIVSFVKKMDYNPISCMNAAPIFFKVSESEWEAHCYKAQKLLEHDRSCGVHSICILDNGYPKKLYDCQKPVVMLFCIGDITLLGTKTITVIGTRKPDSVFVEKGRILVKQLAERGYTIVSGLALGCDTVAHESALRFGAPTIAVLPSPCDDIYPKTNEALADKIVENGGLMVSEYCHGTKFSPFHLVDRDRIQSILSEKTVVIQADDDGGSMIAVRRSRDDGKEVFAIAGNKLKLIDKYIDPDNEKSISQIEGDHKISGTVTLDSF